eukprot:m.509590 g.509590  ORF g.509590 m.509590 type:complete len:60 (+) comp57403_c0_seq6:4095-4274(+)
MGSLRGLMTLVGGFKVSLELLDFQSQLLFPVEREKEETLEGKKRSQLRRKLDTLASTAR